MKIAIGNDHAAVALKKEIMAHLQEKGYEVINVGTDQETSFHYPVSGYRVAKMVAGGEADHRAGLGSVEHGLNVVARFDMVFGHFRCFPRSAKNHSLIISQRFLPENPFPETNPFCPCFFSHFGMLKISLTAKIKGKIGGTVVLPHTVYL